MKTVQQQAEELKQSIERARVFSGERKSSLAARANSTPSAYNHFMQEGHYPTIFTCISYANAVGLRLVLVPMEKERTHAP